MRRGFTLLELTLSMAVLGTIMAAVTSLMVFAGRALPAGDQPGAVSLATRDAAQRVAADIAEATTITVSTGGDIEFTVPDRDANGLPETIRYSWSGTPGQALTWRHNAATPVALASNVHDFAVWFVQETRQTPTAGIAEWGSEQLLGSSVQPASASVTVSGLSYAAQLFTPALPSDAVGCKVTRVDVYARSGNLTAGGTLRVLDVQADGAPGTTVLGSVAETFLLLTGLADAWCPFTLGSAVSVTPGASVYLSLHAPVIKQGLAWSRCEGVAHATQQMATSTDGMTWTVDADDGMAYRVYGMIRRPTTMMLLENVVTSANVRLRIGSGGETVELVVRVPNHPLAP